MKKPAAAKPATYYKVRSICLAKAITAIQRVCREEEPGGAGQKVIGDLATWEIEGRLIAAVREALQ